MAIAASIGHLKHVQTHKADTFCLDHVIVHLYITTTYHAFSYGSLASTTLFLNHSIGHLQACDPQGLTPFVWHVYITTTYHIAMALLASTHLISMSQLPVSATYKHVQTHKG